MEQWKDIQGYEGLYQVSNLGMVKSLDYNHTGKEKLLKPTPNHRGYLTVGLHLNGQVKRFKVHRLVMQSFSTNVYGKPQVNHINGDKNDNRIENLEWCTASENSKHACKTGLRKALKGKIHPQHKTVIQYDTNGNFIKEWNGINNIERVLGISQASIIACSKGRLKTAGGYVWKYKDEPTTKVS